MENMELKLKAIKLNAQYELLTKIAKKGASGELNTVTRVIDYLEGLSNEIKTEIKTIIDKVGE